MNYSESVKYLYDLGNEVLAMKLGLENIRKVLSALGNPEKKYLKVQVAGTNGKGSTCAFLEAMCLAAGIKTGMTTSPHLISVTERVKINGHEISEEAFAAYATKIRAASEKLVASGELETVPTYFEQVTAIALTAFADAQVELAILETGLGGRFDATTATNAELVAVTPIDYDHQQILGDTLTQIAAEKAAIIREDTIAIISEQKEEAMNVLLERCREVNVTPIVNGCNFEEEDSPEVSFKTKKSSYGNTRLSLEGNHQRQNACTAINLAESLAENFKLKISTENIIYGLENAVHKGRLEWRKSEDMKILFDGAHNLAGAKALKAYLHPMYSESQITIVFGAMRDKNLLEIAEILFPLAKNLILTVPDNLRSASIEELRQIAESILDKEKIFTVPNAADAIDAARQLTETYTKTRPSFVCVTGSLYLVGEAQKVL